VVWKRPEEVYGKKMFSLFKKIDVEDVTQGELGNCYFLSCISALAEEPHRIK
jgi:calpain-15